MTNELRNTTDQEAKILLRMAREGVHPSDIERKMRAELYGCEECADGNAVINGVHWNDSDLFIPCTAE